MAREEWVDEYGIRHVRQDNRDLMLVVGLASGMVALALAYAVIVLSTALSIAVIAVGAGAGMYLALRGYAYVRAASNPPTGAIGGGWRGYHLVGSPTNQENQGKGDDHARFLGIYGGGSEYLDDLPGGDGFRVGPGGEPERQTEVAR